MFFFFIGDALGSLTPFFKKTRFLLVPATFPIPPLTHLRPDQVVPGWSEALQLMRQGEKSGPRGFQRLTLPPFFWGDKTKRWKHLLHDSGGGGIASQICVFRLAGRKNGLR